MGGALMTRRETGLRAGAGKPCAFFMIILVHLFFIHGFSALCSSGSGKRPFL
jgi:hypothetical protein